ncbi:MAG: hypothetical protein IT282_04805 [Bacteroidetes bacterium]|nr:hypothetical protein [Bacteroidota bacterium]
MRMLWCVAVALVALGAHAYADDEPAAPRQTLVVYQDLMRKVADSLFSSLPASPPPTTQFNLLPVSTYWFLEQPVHDALRLRSAVPSTSPDADFQAEFGVTRSLVTYENPRRSWFFGAQAVDRVVQLTVWTKLLDHASGKILVARESEALFRDTVWVSEVDALETPGVPATRGTLPAPGIFSSLVEPVVLIGTIAVAIVLLFTVRN